jgi:transmembrane sensor
MKSRIGWRTLARFFAGESPDDEAAAVRTWAEQDRQHAELLEAARRAWDAAEPITHDWNVDAAWSNVEQRMQTPSVIPIAYARARRSRSWVRPAIAAAAVLLIVGPLLYVRYARTDYNTFATGASEQRTIRLPDGSVARLAANSRLQVSRKQAREVRLEGTAFFAVAERDVPFTVHTAAGAARVLGTRFELHAESSAMRLAVLEGKVALVTDDGLEQIVTAGQVSDAATGAPPSTPRAADVHRMIDWMGRVLIFQDTPLEQASQEIERLYGVETRIYDGALLTRTVTATFENENLSTVITTLCRVVDATCVVQDKVIRITQ